VRSNTSLGCVIYISYIYISYIYRLQCICGGALYIKVDTDTRKSEDSSTLQVFCHI